jgi:hypothetical protein
MVSPLPRKLSSPQSRMIFLIPRFEKAEATFPYPFKTPTQNLVVVKQSKAVYDAVSYGVPIRVGEELKNSESLPGSSMPRQ